MQLQWKIFVVVSLWGVVNRPSLKVKALDVADPTVVQLEHTRNQRLSEPVTTTNKRSIKIVGDQFMLDEKPFRIISGSLHYFRLPAVYWRDRLWKLKAAGLNSVATYVEWSYHEPEERNYNFDGDRDLIKFINTAAEEGLYVLLRVGPYICAERDLGGLPYWLFRKYPNIRLRTTDKNFQYETKIWIDKLFSLISKLLYGNGGPIILVQVENEYGSYGSDMDYKMQLRNLFLNQVSSSAILYTFDGYFSSFVKAGSIPGTLITIHFGANTNVTNSFQTLRSFMPQGPLMNSEFYPGWLTHWGERFATANADDVDRTLRAILDYGAHVNFFMFFGGTNFEFTSGANYAGTYQPQITSYDYDAPLTEAGDPTPKYYMIRDTLKEYNLVNALAFEPPKPRPKGNYGYIKLSYKVSLLSAEGRRAVGVKYRSMTGCAPDTFEMLNQRAGLMLYEITVNEDAGVLEISRPRDLVLVYVDGVYKGRISRMRKEYTIQLSTKPGSVLSLLVENQGRINFGHKLHDYKGILSPVVFNDKILNGTWDITGYPLEKLNLSQVFETDEPSGPRIYEGSVTLPEFETPLDTFIDTTGWTKGCIWVNGYNLGRYWPGMGPQVTLYVPGVWLKAAPEENIIQILELGQPSPSLSLEFIDYPILNRTGGVSPL